MAQDYLPYITQNPYAASPRPPDNVQSRMITTSWIQSSLKDVVTKTWGFFSYARQNFYADMNRYKILQKQATREIETDEGQVSLYNLYSTFKT